MRTGSGNSHPTHWSPDTNSFTEDFVDDLGLQTCFSVYQSNVKDQGATPPSMSLKMVRIDSIICSSCMRNLNSTRRDASASSLPSGV